MAVMQMTCTETARELSDFGCLPVLLAVGRTALAMYLGFASGLP